MSAIETNVKQKRRDASVASAYMKLEVALIAVSDVDRAKEFYTKLGWRLDADDVVGNDFRIVQLTPPGSGCSVSFGKGLTAAAPGSPRGGLIVSDIEAAHEELVAKGVNAMRSPERAMLVVTHYQRLLNHIVPDFVHVLVDGRIVRSGGAELALELEAKGYSSFETESESLPASV